MSTATPSSVDVATITKVEVDGLFGLFHHEISFPSDWDFVILHGVNGVGKTKVLDLIKSALGGDIERLLQLPFSGARIDLANGARIHLTRTTDEKIDTPEPRAQKAQLTYSYRRRGHANEELKVDSREFPSLLGIRPKEELERFTPLTPLEDGRYFDGSTGESITSYEAFSRYAELVPTLRRMGPYRLPELPKPIADLWALANVHLIETQRLLSRPDVNARRRPDRAPPPQMSTVARFSQDLVEKIKETLGDLGSKSQELDRTFPERLLRTTRASKSPSEVEVRERYDQQLRLRRRLTQISVLDEFGADIKLPRRQLDPLILSVMVEFLKDSEEKFQVVEPLLDRLELLLGILNQKFQFKHLDIDRERGFVVRTASGSTVRPHLLSSGEQHELVLLYELLFIARSGALILIDEPEISLHINWQKRFLSDLREVGKLTAHRFIVATHSPQIVGRFEDRMVRLTGQ